MCVYIYIYSFISIICKDQSTVPIIEIRYLRLIIYTEIATRVLLKRKKSDMRQIKKQYFNITYIS